MCNIGFCSAEKFHNHMTTERFKHITQRWILRNVEVSEDLDVETSKGQKRCKWKCLSCPLITTSHEDMLKHLEQEAGHKDHVPAFCCLYCAQHHHTRHGLHQHMKEHWTITRPQISHSVCVSVSVENLNCHSSNDNPHDAARRVRHMIAQDTETGATLPVYSGHDFEIGCSSILSHFVIRLLIITSVHPHSRGIVLIKEASRRCFEYEISEREHFNSLMFPHNR